MVAAHRHEDDAGKGFPAILGRRQVSDKDLYGLHGVVLGGLAEQVQVGEAVRQAGFQGGQMRVFISRPPEPAFAERDWPARQASNHQFLSCTVPRLGTMPRDIELLAHMTLE